MSVRRYDTLVLGLNNKKKKKKEEWQIAGKNFFYFARCVRKLHYYDVIHSFDWRYIARDIPAFVMYCVYGESRSSLLIEFTYFMILLWHLKNCVSDTYIQ